MDVRFNVLRNALYHTARRYHYDLLSRGSDFVVLVLGTFAVGDLLKVYPDSQQWIGLAVALSAGLKLVFDFGGRARDHQALQRDYYRLLADIEASADPSPADEKRWLAEMTRIAGDEPPVLRAVDAKAYNDALDALGTYDRAERLLIPWPQRMLGGILPFEGYRYEKISEKA